MDTNRVNVRQHRELIETWLLANDGHASQQQLTWLSEQLATDSASRRAILAMTQQQGWLAWQGGPAPLLSSSVEEGGLVACRPCSQLAPTSWRGRVSQWPRSLFGKRLLSAQALAVAASLVAVIALIRPSTLDEPVANIPSNILEARIVGSTPCVWDSAGVLLHDWNDPLREGDSLQLLEGIAELILQHRSTVAEVTMEGPAAVLLARQAIPTLRYGKITVKTDVTGSDRFPVDTPFGRVMLEASTEVGISVFGSSAQVHVFTGVATVESPWMVSPTQGGENRVVNAGKALFFEGVGDVTLNATDGAASPDRFTPQVSMQSDFLAVGTDYVNEIKSASPVAYWRFEEKGARADSAEVILANDMSDRFRGRVRGKVRWVGPEGNQALEFGVTPEPASMVVDESWDEVLDGDYSLEAWIKPSHYHLGSIIGFIGEFDWTDHRNKHGILLEVGGTSKPSAIHQPERIRFLHRPNLGVQGGVQCFSDQSYQTRRWQHVVAVRSGTELHLYLDGKLVASNRDTTQMAPGLQLVLGQLYTETVERFFIGHVDEVAIYERALTPAEIGRHYELLRPQRSNPKIDNRASSRLTGLSMEAGKARFLTQSTLIHKAMN